jgi:pimeloyl-ACP methyl ester carboxylesterase
MSLSLSVRGEQRGVLALSIAAGAGLALAAACLVSTAVRRFPRIRLSRAEDSPPFEATSSEEDGTRCPLRSVQHQFWTRPQWQYVQLSHGRVRYILRAPAEGKLSSGPVVVLVHGFSIASDIWKQQSDALVDAGRTVLCFDNYGRGWSDSPATDATDWGESLYVGQLAELLFALRIAQPIDLVGVSMGGAIVSAFTAVHPSAVRRLVLVRPAGLHVVTPPSLRRMLSLPFGIGEWMFRRAAAQMQARGAAAQWEDKESDAYRAWGLFAQQNIRTHPGFLRTLHQTVLHFPMADQRHNFRALARQGTKLPVLILWGERDGLTPYSNAAELSELLSPTGAQLLTIVDAKHNMLIERPQPINEALSHFLAYDDDTVPRMPARAHTTLWDQEDTK